MERKKMKIKKKTSGGYTRTFLVTDLCNERFGKLTALKIVGSNDGAVWLCRCDCGKYKKAQGGALTSGHITSCGNHHKEAITTHGMYGTTEYKAWMSMRRRCYDPKNDSYETYKKRGIGVCDGWNKSFETFFADMGFRPKNKTSLDRIDNDKWYSCGHCKECKENGFKLNCRWADSKTQTRNTSYNHFIEINGEKKCLTEWTEIYNTTKNTVYGRVRKGMNIIDAILKPRKTIAL